MRRFLLAKVSSFLYRGREDVICLQVGRGGAWKSIHTSLATCVAIPVTLGHLVRTLCLSVPCVDIYWSLLLVRPRARQGFTETKKEDLFPVLIRFFVGTLGPL